MATSFRLINTHLLLLVSLLTTFDRCQASDTQNYKSDENTIDLTSYIRTSTSIELTWSTRPVIQNTQPGFLFFIRYKECNGCYNDYTYRYSDVLPYNVTGLAPNTCYRFSVQALLHGCDNRTEWSPELLLHTDAQKQNESINFKCKAPYVELEDLPGECFYFSAKVATRHDALKLCNENGGHLAVLDNKKKNYAVQNYLNKYMVVPSGNSKMSWWWIDGIETNGRWVFETKNTDIEYFDFTAEKDNGRKCLYLTTGRTTATWRRWNCFDNEKWDYNYICEQFKN